MNRRHFSQILLGSFAGLSNLAGIQTSEAQSSALGTQKGKSADRKNRLFPTDLPANEWSVFPAYGFSEPACGIIYRRQLAPQNGMPLGAIDTGRIDLQPDATFGFCTAFNSIVPQRGPLNVPFLGMTVANQKWLLCHPPGTDGEYMFAGMQTPAEIHYWGHYPMADLEFDMPGSPVEVGLRCWTPFLPGDAATSNTPGAVLDVHLRNATKEKQSGRLALSFPGPTQGEAQITADSPREKVPYRVYGHTWIPVVREAATPKRQVVRGEFSGLVVSSEQNVGYAMGVVGNAEVEAGGGLNGSEVIYANGKAWGKHWFRAAQAAGS